MGTAAAGDGTAEIIEHMMALVDRLRSGFEDIVAAFDMSAAQAKALRFVAQAGPVPMRDVACGLRCDASNVTNLVDRLEQRGLVARTTATADRRVKTLIVTPEGAELAARMWAQVLDGAAPILGLAPTDQATLLALLRRLDHGPGAACWVTE